MRTLVFVHGRAQEHKHAGALKAEWITAFEQGLSRAGLPMPMSESDVRFPYYGQTLFDLTRGLDVGRAARIIVKGDGRSASEKKFIGEVIQEVIEHAGVADADIHAEAGGPVQKGPLEWEWLQAGLRVVDRVVPGASSGSIALATKDVYVYLNNIGVRDLIESGVRQALPRGQDAVLVSHSLGTVVAYNLLRREAAAQNWRLPLFVTLGSPLGVSAIRRSLRPLGVPTGVGSWFNALDERDIVALYSLDQDQFPVSPPVENWNKVENDTPNRHGIAGYLSDPVVARRVYEAPVA